MFRPYLILEAIDLLYRTFESYSLFNPVEGCPCCVTKEDQEYLQVKPLRQLTKDDLRKYGFKAMTTWGDENDFRHFLPRFVDPEIVLGKLTYGHWQTWPQEEQAAVEAYLRAVWQLVLSHSDGDPDTKHGFGDIDTCLCAIGQAEDDLTPYLDSWLHQDTATAIQQLGEFADQNQYAIAGEDILENAFWKDRQGPMRQVIRWMKDTRTVNHLEDLFFKDVDGPYANELASTIDSLNRIRITNRVEHHAS